MCGNAACCEEELGIREKYKDTERKQRGDEVVLRVSFGYEKWLSIFIQGLYPDAMKYKGQNLIFYPFLPLKQEPKGMQAK
jgi:hypothetical protein